MRLQLALRFVPRDLWVGLYIGGELANTYESWRTYYLCLLPMLPICITVYQARKGSL